MAMTNVRSQSPGKASSDSKKSDSKFAQLGGEGGGRAGTVPGGAGGVGFTPKKGYTEEYCGPGRHLGK